MRLQFNKPVLSIKAFPTVDLPQLTIITGLNGSGKTHLLAAIHAGAVTAHLGDSSTQMIGEGEIALRSQVDMVPNAFGEPAPMVSEAETATAYIDRFNLGYKTKEKLARLFEELGLSEVLEPDGTFLLENVTPEALAERYPLRAMEAEGLAQRIRSWVSETAGEFQEAGNAPGHLSSIASRLKKPIFFLTKKDILRERNPNWGFIPFLQQGLAKLFGTYRKEWIENALVGFAEEGSDVPDPLTAKEFRAKYKDPPWEVLNRLLEALELDFQITVPPLYSLEAFTPQWVKRTTGALVRPEHLSGGEKVLVTLAIASFYSGDGRQISETPRLLLLDEVDAPLHPSMIRQLMSALENVFCQQMGMHVILTTHSPSTVALAPEAALYAMKTPADGLIKTTKAAALAMLLDGVPTLSIAYEGRRHVFVESKFDAEVYELLYQTARKYLTSERTLDFVGVGHSKNGGWNNVDRVVSTLDQAENGSCLGLIDWDATERSVGRRTLVACPEERYSIENVIFDPLLLAAATLYVAPHYAVDLGLRDDLSMRELTELGSAELQTVVDKVASRLWESPPVSTIAVSYLGGFKIQLDSRCLKGKGKHLAEQVYKNLIFLRRIGGESQDKGIDAIARQIARLVVRNCPQFLPVSLMETFNRLLSYEPDGSAKAEATS